MAQFDNEDDNQQPIDVAQYIKQKYLADVPSAAPQGGEFDGTGPTQDKETPVDTSAASETEKADTDPDYSAKGYQDLADSSKDDLRTARGRAANSNSTANFGQALATMFKGSHNLDSSLYNNIREGNSQAVKQATDDRQDMLKNYLMGNNLQRQSVADQRAATEFGWKGDNQKFSQTEHDRQLQQQQNEDKVDSPESAFAQRIAKTLDKNGSYDGLSATQIKAQLPMVKDIYDQTMKQQDMQLRWAQLKSQNENKVSQKDKDRDLKFGHDFNAEKGKFTDATAKIDNTLGMVDQALEGGVSSQLVPLEVARQIAGRLNPQEIAAAGGDPSIMGKLDRLYNKAAAGQMTGTDAQEYRTLLAGQKKHLTDAWNTKSGDRIKTYANTMGRDEKDVRSMLGVNAPPQAQVAPAAVVAPTGGYPKVLTNGTHKATVSSAGEEKEANEAGFK